MTSNSQNSLSTGRAAASRAGRKQRATNNCQPGIQLEGSSGRDELTGTADSDRIRGRGGNDRLLGLGCRDRLLGQAGDDRLEGGADNDRLEGGDDNDRLFGDRGNDTLIGGKGSDLLIGGSGEDNLGGSNGNDILRGGNGSDRIAGGDGDDVIVGGFGADRLTGGDGNNRYLYSSTSEGRDRIVDFDTDDDKIDLSRILNDSKYNDSNQFRDYMVIVNDGNDTLIRVDPDGENGDLIFRTLVRLVDVDFADVKRSNFVL